MGPNDIFISITDLSTGVYKVKRCVHSQKINSYIMAFNMQLPFIRNELRLNVIKNPDWFLYFDLLRP